MSSSASSTSSVSSQYSHHRPLNGQVKKRNKSSQKSTIVGKSTFQVEKRNARERKRVQAVNQGYEVLAKQISDWDKLKNKKLTKAETLKAAIMYIQHLEDLLISPGTQNSQLSTPSPASTSQSKSSIKPEPYIEPVKTETSTFNSQNHQQLRQFHQIPTQNNCINGQSYSPPVYNSYFNGMLPIQHATTPTLPMNCQLEYGNENHFRMQYDFNTGRYS